MTMPDVIYAKIISIYEICCPACWLKQWDEDDNKDGSEPYYSQSKVDELLDHIQLLQEEVYVLRQYGNKDCTAMADERLTELRNAKIGDSDE